MQRMDAFKPVGKPSGTVVKKHLGSRLHKSNILFGPRFQIPDCEKEDGVKEIALNNYEFDDEYYTEEDQFYTEEDEFDGDENVYDDEFAKGLVNWNMWNAPKVINRGLPRGVAGEGGIQLPVEELNVAFDVPQQREPVNAHVEEDKEDGEKQVANAAGDRILVESDIDQLALVPPTPNQDLLQIIEEHSPSINEDDEEWNVGDQHEEESDDNDESASGRIAPVVHQAISTDDNDEVQKWAHLLKKGPCFVSLPRISEGLPSAPNVTSAVTRLQKRKHSGTSHSSSTEEQSSKMRKLTSQGGCKIKWTTGTSLYKKKQEDHERSSSSTSEDEDNCISRNASQNEQNPKRDADGFPLKMKCPYKNLDKCTQKDCDVYELCEHICIFHKIRVEPCRECFKFVRNLATHRRETHMQNRECFFCSRKLMQTERMHLHTIHAHSVAMGVDVNKLKVDSRQTPQSHPLDQKLDTFVNIKSSPGYKLSVRGEHLVVYDTINKLHVLAFQHVTRESTTNNIGKQKFLPFRMDRLIGVKHHVSRQDMNIQHLEAGHLAACRDHCNNIHEWQSTFLEGNIVAMGKHLNNGPMQAYDDYVRKWLVWRADNVYKLNIVVYDDSDPNYECGRLEALPLKEVWKVTIIERDGVPLHQVLCFPNKYDEKKQHFTNFKSTIAELRNASGLDILPSLMNMEETWSTERLKTKCIMCPFCCTIFQSQECLRAHCIQYSNRNAIDKIDNSELYNCAECPKTYLCKVLLGHHVRLLHTIENTTRCKKCGIFRNLASGLIRHQKIAHPEIVNWDKFKPTREYFAAVKKHNESMLLNSSEKLLPQPNRTGIWTANPESISDQTATPFFCEVCNQYFVAPDSLASHILTSIHHAELIAAGISLGAVPSVNEPAIGSMEAGGNSSVGYKCYKCDKIFETIEAVNAHRKSVHNFIKSVTAATAMINVTAQVESNQSNVNITRDMGTHSSARSNKNVVHYAAGRHPCLLCGKVSKYACTDTKHNRIMAHWNWIARKKGVVVPTQPCKCIVCDHLFITPSCLKRHLKRPLHWKAVTDDEKLEDYPKELKKD